MEPKEKQRRLGSPVLNLGIPSRGMNRAVPATNIPIEWAYEGFGIRMGEGIIRPVKGRKKVGSTLTGDVQAIHRILDYAGSPQTLCVTTSNLYRWDTGSDDWTTEGTGLSGDLDYPLTHCYGLDTFVFTNGVDWVQEYDPSSNTMGDLTGGGGYQAGDTKHKCRVVRFFNNSLVLFNTIEDGNNVYQRVRWSDVGYLENWSSDNFQDLVETPEPIVAAEQMGTAMVIYKENMIIWMEPLEGGVFHFGRRTKGVGAVATRAVIPVGTAHIFLGKAEGIGFNVFVNNNGQIDAIGDPIQPVLNYELNRSKIGRSWGYWDPDERAVMLFVPAHDSNLTDRLYRYEIPTNDIFKGRWWRDEVTYNAGGKSPRSDYIAYEDLSGGLEDQSWYYGDAREAAEADQAVWGDSDGETVVLYASKLTDKSDAAFPQRLVSKAVNFKDLKGAAFTRVQSLGLDLVLRGGSVDVYYSTDEGTTWTSVETISLTTSWERKRCHFKCSGDSVMVKLENTSTDAKFQLRDWGMRIFARGRR